MEIELKGRKIYIDEDDLAIFNSRVWHISDTGYVLWRGVENGIKHTIRLHREIIGATTNEIVDHINRNKLDNRRQNLRICTQRVNVLNSDRVEKAKGYYFDKAKRRWTVDSQKHRVKSIYVDTEQDAKNYMDALNRGETPTKVLTRRIVDLKIDSKMSADIINLVSIGVPYYKIAEKYGLAPSTVSRHYNKRRNKGVDNSSTT